MIRELTKWPDPILKQVTGINLRGEQLSFRCSGWLSRVIQHEVDHLNGISIRSARPDV